jgi:LysR family transcriptional regulator for metE and metH
MDLEVRHLRLVQAVAAEGSLTRAGGVLNLTQSALSHQLRDIEARLETPLFLRVGKRMLLTPAGERVLKSAEDVLAALERTEQAVRTLAGSGQGVLRLATECYTCYHWLPPLIKRFRRQHPRIEIRIDPAATSDPVGHLIDGRLDLAIVSDPCRDRRVIVAPLFEDEVVGVMAPGHPLATRPYLRPEDFEGETLFTYSPKEDSTVYQKFLLPAGVTPVLQPLALTEAAIEMTKAGLGMAVLAWWVVEPVVRSGALRAVPMTRRGWRRTWSAATLKDLARVPQVKGFIELMAARPPFRERVPPRDALPRIAALR